MLGVGEDHIGSLECDLKKINLDVHVLKKIFIQRSKKQNAIDLIENNVIHTLNLLV